MVVHEGEREIEVYGESPARPIFSATFPAVGARALSLAKSELRLEPEVEPVSFAELLPKPVVFPPNHDPAVRNLFATRCHTRPRLQAHALVIC